MRAYTNDVFLVENGTVERHVLKVYGADWRRDSEIRYETALVDHLSSKGIRVARPVPGKNGEVLQHIDVNGVRRQAVLSEYAAGDKPRPPFSLDMYHKEGQATAALHHAADDFFTSHKRRNIDLAYLIDDPLSFLADKTPKNDDALFIRRFGELLRARIERHIDRGLDWGCATGT